MFINTIYVNTYINVLHLLIQYSIIYSYQKKKHHQLLTYSLRYHSSLSTLKKYTNFF